MRPGTVPLLPFPAILLEHFNNHFKHLMSNAWYLTAFDAGSPSLKMPQISPPLKPWGDVTRSFSCFCIILSEGADRWRPFKAQHHL